MSRTQDRNNVRVANTYGAARLAFPWIQMNESSADNSKECNVCWESCSKYLLCSEHKDHCVCSDCAYNMLENRISITSEGSIDIKWKCPICRHDNPLGCWQFLPENTSSINPSKSPEQQQETRPFTRSEPPEQQQETRPITQPEPPEQQQETRPITQPEPPVEVAILPESYYHESSDEESHARYLVYRWIVSYKWPKSRVNEFKAWYLYNNSHILNLSQPPGDLQKLIPPQVLSKAKRDFNYKELRYCPTAPWFGFLKLGYRPII